MRITSDKSADDSTDFVPPQSHLSSGRQVLSVSVLRLLLPLVFALLYATILASLPLDVFKDRENYLNYAVRSDLILAGYAAVGWKTVLANEPAWLLFNIGLASFVTPETTVRTVIFVSALLVSFTLLRKNWQNALWMICFLLGPQIIKDFIIHLRQGLALAIFMLGFYAGPRWLRIGLMGIAGLIHSSFLVVAAIGTIAWTTNALRFPPLLRVLMFLASCTFLGFLLEPLAGNLGARQGERYLQIALDVSGLGFLLWLFVLILFLSQGKNFIRGKSFAIGILSFYILAYFLTPVSARVFESGILIVLTAGVALGGWRRQAFLGVILLYLLLMYLMRLDQPWLGWSYA